MFRLLKTPVQSTDNIHTFMMPHIETVMELVLERRRYSENVRNRARVAPTPTTKRTWSDSCWTARMKSGDSTMSEPEVVLEYS